MLDPCIIAKIIKSYDLVTVERDGHQPFASDFQPTTIGSKMGGAPTPKWCHM